jgi:hypothetical protein
MTPTGENHQLVEVCQQIGSAAAPFHESRALGAANPALHGVLVEAMEYLVQVGFKVDLVREVSAGGMESVNRSRLWPNLHIPPRPPLHFHLHVGKNSLQVFSGFKQGLAVIGKRKRYDPSSCEPTWHSGEEERVFQRTVVRRRRKG